MLKDYENMVAVINIENLTHNVALNIEDATNTIRNESQDWVKFAVGHERPNCLVLCSKEITQEQADVFARVGYLTQEIWERSRFASYVKKIPIDGTRVVLDDAGYKDLCELVETLEYDHHFNALKVGIKGLEGEWQYLYY